MRIGYACMNLSLKAEGFNKKRLFKQQFKELGLNRVAELTLHNIDHLVRVIEWNECHKIRLFRFTQIFPWIDQYELEDLPQFESIRTNLLEAGKLARKYGHRLTVHPSEFCVVASPRSDSVTNSIRELNQTARIFDLMGYSPSPFNKINIHVGGFYGDKEGTAIRFCENLTNRGTSSLLGRITLENDDKKNGFSLKDLYCLISNKIGIPLVLDYFHHTFNPGDLTLQEALELAISTWPRDVTPVIHYSESKRDYEDAEANKIAHSSFLHQEIPTFNHDLDIMIEAKQTEKAVLQYLAEHKSFQEKL